MKQHTQTSNKVPAKLVAIFIGAALMIIGSSYYFSFQEKQRAREMAGYRIESSTSAPAILPGMMNGFISVETVY